MSIRKTSLARLIFHTEYLIIMNLSIFELAYLGSQAKDTPHSGKSNILRFGHAQFVADATDAQWMRYLGLGQQPDWPLAELLWLAETTDTKKLRAENSSLLLAQPVHLSLQRDSFGLDALITLSSDEYLAFTQLLNNFFVEEGLRFIPSDTQQYWFLQSARVWHFTTFTAQSAMYQNIQQFMPQGLDVQKLRQVMNQVQMLLHEHPINQQRMANGLFEMNSIWFSGHSISDVLSVNQDIHLIGNNPLTKAISNVFNLPCFEEVVPAKKHALMLVDNTNHVPWDDVFAAVRSGKIQHLNANFPVLNGTFATIPYAA